MKIICNSPSQIPQKEIVLVLPTAVVCVKMHISFAKAMVL
jgi:hypothetical protein